MTIFCLIEVDGEAVADASRRALTLARGLAGAGPGLAAVVFGDVVFGDGDGDGGLGQDLAAYGVTDVHAVSGLPGYAPQAWARVLAGLLASAGDAMVAAGTDRGNEVLAHVGAITGLPMAANCTTAVDNGGGFAIIRQRWAGLLLEEAVLDAPAALLTVATDAVAAEPLAVPADGPAAVAVHPVLVPASVTDGDLAVRAVETPAGAGGVSLATARVVVGGGRGVGSAEGFAPLEELAELLGGVVGVSRVVTSEGWRPHTQQVGQTGTKITPDLYLACGISGAIQHIAGCSGARNIIAINTDPAAPMMTRADYAVIGNLHEVIPVLVKALRDRSLGVTAPQRDNRLVRFHRVRVVRRMPHAERGFTQGLVADGFTVWESTGYYGRSTLRKYELGANAVHARAQLPAELFGEGICRLGESVWQLTWRERVALRWDATTLKLRERVPYNREGWGMCAVGGAMPSGATSGAEVVTSDGTSELVRRDPATLEPREVVHVRCRDQRVRGLNDLTWAGGLVWANVAGTDCVAGIDLETGNVTDVVDARGATERHWRDPQAIMNGIAALAQPGEFLLTGKGWRSIRQVRLVPDREHGHIDRLLAGLSR